MMKSTTDQPGPTATDVPQVDVTLPVPVRALRQYLSVRDGLLCVELEAYVGLDDPAWLPTGARLVLGEAAALPDPVLNHREVSARVLLRPTTTTTSR